MGVRAHFFILKDKYLQKPCHFLKRILDTTLQYIIMMLYKFNLIYFSNKRSMGNHTNVIMFHLSWSGRNLFTCDLIYNSLKSARWHHSVATHTLSQLSDLYTDSLQNRHRTKACMQIRRPPQPLIHVGCESETWPWHHLSHQHCIQNKTWISS